MEKVSPRGLKEGSEKYCTEMGQDSLSWYKTSEHANQAQQRPVLNESGPPKCREGSVGFLWASQRRHSALYAGGGWWCLGLSGKLERGAWH